MPLSRRSFLRSGTSAVLTTAAVLQVAPNTFAKSNPTGDLELPPGSAQSPLSSFKRENFEPYIGETFRVSMGAHSQDMKLTGVRGYEPSAHGKKLAKRLRPTDSFALDFNSPGVLSELTTIYSVEHAGLGKFALFLTRRDISTGGHSYEAVFNHV